MFLPLLLACVYEDFLAFGEGEATLVLEPLEEGDFEPVVWEAASPALPEDASSWWHSEAQPGEVRAVLREEHASGHYEWFGGGDQRGFELLILGEESGGPSSSWSGIRTSEATPCSSASSCWAPSSPTASG